jgi:DNA polymerase I-like protein with 3'-5' exonuclease and polymerase domains
MARVRKGMRECLVAREGFSLISVDFDAFEMRTWAQILVWLFGFSACALPAILNDPKRCPHVEFGSRIYTASDSKPDLTFEEAYALKKLDPKEFKALRGLAKGPNFGLPGGMSAKRLVGYCYSSYGVSINLEMAETMVAVWKEMYPEADPYLSWVKDQVGRKYGSKAQITQFFSKRLRGRVGYTNGANGFFQGLAADIAKIAYSRACEEAYCDRSSDLYGSYPAAFIHDEELMESPDEQRTEAGLRLATIFTETAMEICPDVLFTAAPAAMKELSKAAGDPHWLKDGALADKYSPGAKLITYEEFLQRKAA